MHAEVPFHVFAIPDGNRRWARLRGLSASQGHRQGYIALKEVLRHVWDYGVTHFTFWGLSQDNLMRDPVEVVGLFDLLELGIAELSEELTHDTHGVRVRVCGDWRTLPVSQKLVHTIEDLESSTAARSGPVFTLLLAYDGDEEDEAALGRFQEATRRAIHLGDPLPRCDRETRRSFRWTAHLPDIDLMIRTGSKGDPHLSANALMFQMQNPMLAFPNTFWPDFTPAELKEIVTRAQKQERRLGA